MNINYLYLYLSVFFIQCFVIEYSASQSLIFSKAPGRKIKFRRDYIYIPELQEFIKINEKRKTWNSAKAYCEAEGAKLAVIRNQTEADIFQEIINAYPENSRDLWVGLHDLLIKGEFQSIDGTPIEQLYSKWGDNEPNNAGGHEDCVNLSNMRLNDNTCSTTHPFLCQKDLATVKYNRDCDNFDLGYKSVLNNAQCIKFHKEPKTWDEAYAICIAEEAQLAVINSPAEAELYRQEFNNYPKEKLTGNFNKDVLLLGFHDKLVEGDYVTVSGEKLNDSGYEVWASGQPDNWNNNENCGSMFREGTLNDMSCNDRAMYICEKKND